MESFVPVADEVMNFNLIAPGVQTKVNAEGFEASDKIGVYVTDYVDEVTPMPLQISGNRANNVAVTFDGETWTAAQTTYWGECKSDVFAYYPYTSEIKDVNDHYFEVSVDQEAEGCGNSDFLWAKASGVAQKDGAVNLAMNHVMSKLTVKVVAGEDYIGSLPEDAKVQLHSTVTAARVDLETGAVAKDPYSGVKSITMKNLGVRTFEGEKAVVYEAIVVPQMIEGSVPLFEINAKSVSYLIEDPFNFRPGTAYTYTITLNTSTTAIKVEIGCELEDWNNAGGDSGEGEGDSGDPDEPGEGDEEDDAEYVDLSEVGTANCYLVQQAGDYKFKAVIGNSDATVGNVKSVEVLWESFGTDEMPQVGDLIASVSYKDGYVHFSTPEDFRDGNAVIAVRNSKGLILWSWHIWCAEEGWQEQVYYNDAGTMMDRNLGATSVGVESASAFGLMYQLGRKDPFLGSSSVSDCVVAASTGYWEYSSASADADMLDEGPTTYYSYNSWYTGRWTLVKGINDPCPAGWRLPESGASGIWARASGRTDMDMVEEGEVGLNLSGVFADDDLVWYPLAGYLNSDGELHGVSSYGAYWGYREKGYNSFNFSNYGDFYPAGNNYYFLGQSNAYPVRCCKE